MFLCYLQFKTSVYRRILLHWTLVQLEFYQADKGAMFASASLLCSARIYWIYSKIVWMKFFYLKLKSFHNQRYSMWVRL
ncbi:hypothetical protein O3M35_011105 [Rhynocoris fuscipes]|uniref:Uncharacterized protein n=1 Tax=Rhynocoris fuscipes TaxID=488301 RepID=A0AAW1CZK1_9HEMI